MEKRSGMNGIAPVDMVRCKTVKGVGGRHRQGQPLAGGGGYLDDCPFSEFPDGAKKNRARDPRLDDLRRMGMHHSWQRVAEEIGMDAFLVMWRILDAEDQWRHPKGGLELTLRRYKSYEHFQRDMYIFQLRQAGVSIVEIREKLLSAFGVKLECSRIKSILSVLLAKHS
ncbi:hypothetical protein ACUXVY_16035 [Chromobacterium haemolyticum]|uniref:hypothetical protein n=1 Tax=Chromobacterium haemolyticum TaxID=394935 RepID=UPI00405695E7